MTLPQDSLVDAIHKALELAVKEIANKEIELAKKRIEEQVQKEVGAIAIRVAQWAEVKTMQDRIVIEVRIDKFRG